MRGAPECAGCHRLDSIQPCHCRQRTGRGTDLPTQMSDAKFGTGARKERRESGKRRESRREEKGKCLKELGSPTPELSVKLDTHFSALERMRDAISKPAHDTQLHRGFIKWVRWSYIRDEKSERSDAAIVIQTLEMLLVRSFLRFYKAEIEEPDGCLHFYDGIILRNR